MKDILEIRTNPVMLPDPGKKQFELKPILELIIIHTDGKNYRYTGKSIVSDPKFSETRFFIDSHGLKKLQADLQLIGDQMNRMEVNTMKINALVQIAEDAQKEVNNG